MKGKVSGTEREETTGVRMPGVGGVLTKAHRVALSSTTCSLVFGSSVCSVRANSSTSFLKTKFKIVKLCRILSENNNSN